MDPDKSANKLLAIVEAWKKRKLAEAIRLFSNLTPVEMMGLGACWNENEPEELEKFASHLIGEKVSE